METLKNYNIEKSKNEKFSNITLKSYKDLSDKDKFRYFDFCKTLAVEKVEDEIEIIAEEVDLEDFLKSNGAIKKEDAFKAFSSKAKINRVV